MNKIEIILLCVFILIIFSCLFLIGWAISREIKVFLDKREKERKRKIKKGEIKPKKKGKKISKFKLINKK